MVHAGKEGKGRDVIGPRQDTTTSPGQARHWGGEGDCSTDQGLWGKLDWGGEVRNSPGQGVGYGRGIKGLEEKRTKQNGLNWH